MERDEFMRLGARLDTLTVWWAAAADADDREATRLVAASVFEVEEAVERFVPSTAEDVVAWLALIRTMSARAIWRSDARACAATAIKCVRGGHLEAAYRVVASAADHVEAPFMRRALAACRAWIERELGWTASPVPAIGGSWGGRLRRAAHRERAGCRRSDRRGVTATPGANAGALFRRQGEQPVRFRNP